MTVETLEQAKKIQAEIDACRKHKGAIRYHLKQIEQRRASNSIQFGHFVGSAEIKFFDNFLPMDESTFFTVYEAKLDAYILQKENELAAL